MDREGYLKQAYFINTRIDSKLEQIGKLRSLAMKVTAGIREDIVSESPNPTKKEGIICKIIDMEKELNEDINGLVDLQREIYGVINTVNVPEYRTLLELRYLNFKKWEEIAVIMGFDIRHVYRIRKKAIEAIQLDFS